VFTTNAPPASDRLQSVARYPIRKISRALHRALFYFNSVVFKVRINMSDARSWAFEQIEKAKKGQLEKIDTNYKKEAMAYYKEQRELVADQKRYSKSTFLSTVITSFVLRDGGF
jgi:hypothetical protein